MFRSTADKKRNRVLTYFFLTWQIIKTSILAEMEYRTSFIIKVGGMILNDFGHLVLWLVFFKKFPVVNGWNLHDTVLLLSLSMTSYGFLVTVSGGIIEIAKTVASGGFDYYLALPKSPQWHISVDRIIISGLGDLIFGFGLFFIAGDPTPLKTVALVVASILSALILYNFTVMVHTLAFYFGDFEESAERWFWTLIGFGFYPQNVFFGALKIVTFTLLPAFFIFAVPINLIRNFNFFDMAVLFAAAIVTSILAAVVFRAGIKHYESGNLINNRI